MKTIIDTCNRFIGKCKIDNTYAYKPYINAEKNTLYSSTFSVMALQYTGELEKLSEAERTNWGEYINSFQSIQTGLYDSHELHDELGVYHNLEHRQLHLTCHVLPALALLGVKPKYPITFTEKYLDKERLAVWLAERDLKMAWVEGNNLLFVGQLLVHEIENYDRGYEALEQLFNWLNSHIDPKTGLWGTDQGCELHGAMYGAYHQLILYFYLNRTIPHYKELIDATLSCQHFDGGFSKWRGGGTCQDIDGIDILVNCYKKYNYRRRDIRRALRAAKGHIIADRYVADSGFQDRKNGEFIHNSMPATKTPANYANTFSTWFTLHALIGIESVLSPNQMARFNNSCSMGWGRAELDFYKLNIFESYIDNLFYRTRRVVVWIYDRVKK